MARHRAGSPERGTRGRDSIKRQGRPGGSEKRDSGGWVLARQTQSRGSAAATTASRIAELRCAPAPLFAHLGPPRNGPSLIPAGDPCGSRGQRPRKMRPPQGPTLKGSYSGDVISVLRPTAQGDTTPSGSGNDRRAFRGRCPRLLSCALAGHERTTVRPYPLAPVSDITDSHFRPCVLRMTGIAGVAHVAASKRVRPSMPKGGAYIQVNVCATREFCQVLEY